jgi:hypothetical protein
MLAFKMRNQTGGGESFLILVLGNDDMSRYMFSPLVPLVVKYLPLFWRHRVSNKANFCKGAALIGIFFIAQML